VKSLRQRHKPWADEFIEEHGHIFIPNPTENKGNWTKVFGNHNPIHLEIGTGKGQFIIGMAKQYPNVNFIGLEVSKSVIVNAGEKLLQEELPNVKLILADANMLLDYFSNNEISELYLNFSDPWPKNRHAKRRLTFHTFLKQYEEILQRDKSIVFKTDNRKLFEYSLVSMSQFGMCLDDVTLDLHELCDETNVKTEYEEKFSTKGQPIYRVKARFEVK